MSQNPTGENKDTKQSNEMQVEFLFGPINCNWLK